MKIVLIMLTFLTLFSCSQQSEKTEMKVSFGAASADFPGGVFVIGKHRQSGIKFSKQLGGSQIDLNLINGTWDFVGVGWEGGSNFSGNIKCGKTLNVNLNGNPVKVGLNLIDDNCQGAAGTFNPATNDPYPYKIHTCALFDRRQQFAQGDNLITLCDEVSGGHQSFKVVWYEFNESVDPFNNRYNPMKTGCVNVSTGVATFSELIPSFGGAWGLPTTIEAHKTSGCADSTPEQIHFPNGIMSQGLVSNLSAVQPDGSYVHAMITDNICVGAALNDNSNYGNGGAFGSLTSGDLAVICNKNQFIGIISDANAEAKFLIGHDINLSGAANFELGTSTEPFNGELDGLGFKIQNFNNTYSLNDANTTAKGLINFAKSALIKNLVLKNADLNVNYTTGTGVISAGLLVGRVLGKTNASHRDTKIENITIDANSSLTFSTDLDYSTYGGGVVGSVSLPTALHEEVLLRDITSSAEVQYDYDNNVAGDARDDDVTGGIIGSTALSTPTGGALVVLEDITMNADIYGARNVGGIIGKSKATELRFNNKYNGTIYGTENIGGLVGTGSQTRIRSSMATLTYVPQVINNWTSSPMNNGSIGGLVGHLDGLSVINGAVGNLSIDSSISLSEVGGIVGHSLSSTADHYNYIINARGEVNIEADGEYIGGIVGNMVEFDLSPPNDNIQYSSALGQILTKTTGSGNFKRGGLAGYLKGTARMNILDVNVVGHQYIGGVVGYLDGILQEIHQFADVEATLGTDSYHASPVVGYIGLEDNIVVEHIISEGNLIVGANNCDSLTYLCGMIMGGSVASGWSADPTVNNVLATGDTINGISNTTYGSPIKCDNSNGTCGTFNFTNTELTVGSYTFSGPYNSQKLAFKDQWDTWGLSTKTLFDNIEPYYKTGSLADDNEAFYIYDEDDWNAIGSDAFLMSKAFVIANDLDFQSTSFTPLGGTGVDNKFIGTLLANKKKIKNVNITTASNDTGIIKMVGGDERTYAHIGTPDDPLVIEDFSIDTGTNTVTKVGVIADADTAHISIHAKGEITSTSGAGNYYGGIIGQARNINMENCYFEGKINALGKGDVGGLIGSVYNNNANHRTRIKNSKVKTHLIKGFRLVGGAVGQSYNSVAGAASAYENNYVEITQDPVSSTVGKIEATSANDPTAGSNEGYVGGFVATHDGPAGSIIKISRNYVANVDGVIGSVISASSVINADAEKGFTTSNTDDNIGLNSLGTVDITDNFYIDSGGTATSSGTIDEETNIANISTILAGHPWVYDSNAGSLKLYWEAP